MEEISLERQIEQLEDAIKSSPQPVDWLLLPFAAAILGSLKTHKQTEERAGCQTCVALLRERHERHETWAKNAELKEEIERLKTQLAHPACCMHE